MVIVTNIAVYVAEWRSGCEEGSTPIGHGFEPQWVMLHYTTLYALQTRHIGRNIGMTRGFLPLASQTYQTRVVLVRRMQREVCSCSSIGREYEGGRQWGGDSA